MDSILLVVEFVLTVLITIVVMLQKSSSIGLGAYSSSNETVFGAKGPEAFLSKLTVILSIVFIINTVALGYLYSSKSTASVIDSANIKIEQSSIPTPPPAPAVK
ncbi:MAG: preprotein translocase subunit SecG [Campylobacterota bacterium]|nr:preprotein translocase subunit SecG [Campylobacterota bacterium]